MRGVNLNTQGGAMSIGYMKNKENKMRQLRLEIKVNGSVSDETFSEIVGKTRSGAIPMLRIKEIKPKKFVVERK